MRMIIALALAAYKYCLSPFLPPACRFLPTCSEYAKEAVVRHGVCKGALLAVCRLARCNPLFQGGHDPVPDSFSPFRFPYPQVFRQDRAPSPAPGHAACRAKKAAALPNEP
jgi:uncharacterized protein